METSEFIDNLAAGNAAAAKEALNDMLSARAFEALEGRKVELAKNLYNGKENESGDVEVQDTEDTAVEQ
jgi:hypothetical protein